MTDQCTWTEDFDGNWSSDCGMEWVFEYRVDEDPNMLFCSRCGKRIKFIRYEEENDD